MINPQQKIEAAAREYPSHYELVHMNAGTPRLSGREYLEHGFTSGANFCAAMLIEMLRTNEMQYDNEVVIKNAADWLQSKLDEKRGMENE